MAAKLWISSNFLTLVPDFGGLTPSLIKPHSIFPNKLAPIRTCSVKPRLVRKLVFLCRVGAGPRGPKPTIQELATVGEVASDGGFRRNAPHPPYERSARFQTPQFK